MCGVLPCVGDARDVHGAVEVLLGLIAPLLALPHVVHQVLGHLT